MPVTVIKSLDTVRDQMRNIWDMILALLKSGKPVEIEIREVKKSRLMEKKYHAMFRDVAKCVSLPVIDCQGNEIPGQFRKYDAVFWKVILVNRYEKELIAMGECLKSPSKTFLCPYTGDKVTERASTSGFRKSEAGGFIEFLYAFGAENKVVWSDDYMRFWKEYGARW